MLAIYDQIQELRAELGCHILTRAVRADARMMLEMLLAQQVKLDHDFEERNPIRPG